MRGKEGRNVLAGKPCILQKLYKMTYTIAENLTEGFYLDYNCAIMKKISLTKVIKAKRKGETYD